MSLTLEETMKRKVIVSYKKNGLFNQAILTLDRKIAELLELGKNDTIFLNYLPYQITLQKKQEHNFEKTIHSAAGEVIEFTKIVKVLKSFSSRKNNYFNYKISLPSIVAKSMCLLENPEVNIEFTKDQVLITTTELKRGESISPLFPISKEERGGNHMSKVFTIKVNKGGIGKTFLTVQLGHGLASQGYKVLLLTSDSQNNILHYTKKKKEIEKYNLKKGLRHVVLYGDHEELYIKIRDNLDFIPTESSVFTENFERKFSGYLESKKQEYDFILIDSVPTMDIDKTFMKCSDRLIIPSFCDYSTINGTLNVIEEVGAEKIHSIMINLYKATKTQKEYYNQLQEAIGNTNIIFPNPIKELSQIEYLLEEGKTVWESKSKKLLETQNSLVDIIIEMIK